MPAFADENSIVLSARLDTSPLLRDAREADRILESIGKSVRLTGLDQMIGSVASRTHQTFGGMVQSAARSFNDLSARAQASMGAINPAIEKTTGLVNTLRGATNLASAVFSGALIKGLFDSTKHASDLSESINKTQVIFGSASDKVLEFGRNADVAIGTSNAAALGGIASFGNLFKAVHLSSDASADMSVHLAKLAADLGSLHNVDPTLMLEKMRAGLVGEAEPLRAVGVLLSETAVKQEAYRSGLAKTGAILTDQQKMLARYQIIVGQSATAMGDFANTSTGMANASRILNAQIENLSADMGRLLLPITSKVISGLSSMVKQFSEMPDSIKTTALALAGLGAAAGPLSFAISGIGAALTALTGPIGLTALAIGGLSVAYINNVGDLQTATKEAFAGLKGLYKEHGETIATLKDAIAFNFKVTTSLLGAAVGNMAATLRVGMRVVNGEWEDAWQLTKETADRNIAAWKPVLDKGKEITTRAWEGITAAFLAGAEALLAKAKETWARFPEIVSFYVDQVPEYLGFVGGLVVGKVAEIGANMSLRLYAEVQEMVNGVARRLDLLVAETGIFGATWTDTLLNIASLAVKGFSEGIWKIPGLVMDAFGSAVEFLEGLPGRMFDLGIDIASSLGSGFSSGFGHGVSGNAGGAFSSLVSRMFGATDGLAGQLKKEIEASGAEIDRAFADAMAKAELAAKIGGDKAGLAAGTAAAKKIKDVLDRNSPLISERVLAGSPGQLDKMIGGFAENVARSIAGAKPIIQLEIEDLANTFSTAWQKATTGKASGTERSNFVFGDFAKDIHAAIPEIEQALGGLKTKLQSQLADLGIDNASRERIKESFVRTFMEADGITDQVWKNIRKNNKEGAADLSATYEEMADKSLAALDALTAGAAKLTEKNANDLDRWFAMMRNRLLSLENFARLLKGELTKTEIDLDATEKHWESFGISVERTLKRQSDSIMTWSEAVDAATDRVRASLLNSIDPFDKMRLAADAMVGDSIQQFEALARSLGLVGDAYNDFVINHVQQAIKQLEVSLIGATEIERARIEEQIKILQEAGPRILKEYTDSINQLPGALNKTFDKMLDVLGVKDLELRSKAKGMAAGLIEVFSNLPGEWGRKLQEGTNSVLSWINRIDNILKGLHKIWSRIPDGLSAAIEAVGKIFKQAGKDVEEATEGWTKVIVDGYEHTIKSSSKSGEESGESFSEGFMSKLTLIASGLSTFFGTRGQGRLAGTLGGALAGAQIGSAIAPGIGTIIGAGAGAIFGSLFGTGKSAEQKAAEEAAKKRAADEAKLLAEELKQSYVKSLSDTLALASQAREFLEGLAGRVHVPKEEIRAFFKQLGQVLTLIVEESKRFTQESYKAVKALGTNFAPAVELLSRMPLVFEGINGHFGLAVSSVQRYFQDFRLILSLISVEAEETPIKLQKITKKFSERMLPAVELFTNLIGGLKEAFDIKPIRPDALANYGAGLDAVIRETGTIAERFDKFYIKVIQFFAERVGPAVSLFRETVATIREAIDIPRLHPTAIRNVYADLDLIVKAAIDFSNATPTEDLTKAAAIAEKVMPWINIIKGLGDALNPIRAYKSVKDEFAILLEDFKQSTFMMRILDDYSAQIETWATSIEGHLTRAVKAMTNSISAFGPELGKLAGLLTAGMSSLNVVANPEIFGGDFSGLSFAGAGEGRGFSAFTPAPSPVVAPAAFGRPAPSAPGPTIINKYFIVQPGGVQIAADTIEKLNHAIEISEEVAEEMNNVENRVITMFGGRRN